MTRIAQMAATAWDAHSGDGPGDDRAAEEPESRPTVAVDRADEAWGTLLPDAEAWACRLLTAALEEETSPGPMTELVELSLVLADDEAVRALNRDWRGRDRPTNVLSFPAEDDIGAPGAPRLLGDVILARETVLAEAARDGKSPRDHALHLILHGILHCLGHDHETVEEAADMEALETAILGRFGIADPYSPESPEGAGSERAAK